MAAYAAEEVRALQEVYESRFLATANAAQVNADPNLINGFAHRIASAEGSNRFQLSDVIKMKLGFDKANVPAGGRILIVDPVAAATLDGQVSIGRDVTPFAERILQDGFDREHQFLMDLYGFTVLTSNRLPKGAFGDGTTSVTDGVANIAMCVSSDQHRPIMSAWRRMPKTEGERNKDLRRDEFVTSSRYALGAQRVDTLGVYITSASNF